MSAAEASHKRLEGRLLFKQGDIATLAKAARLPLVQHVAPATLCWALEDAISQGRFFHKVRLDDAVDDRARYADVVKHVDALTKLMGADSDLLFPEDVFFWGGRLRDAISMRSSPDTTAMHNTLNQLPTNFRHLRTLATLCANERRLSSRPAEIGLDALFTALAGVYFASFGVKPSIGADRSEPDKPSLRWVALTLKLFAERVSLPAGCKTSKSQLAATARALSAASKANRLRDGWNAWRKLPPDQQWIAPIWFPNGYDEPGVMVPKGYPSFDPS